MSAKRLRIAAFLLLAGYVLALTVGASFHLHGEYPCAADRARSASGRSPDAAELPGGHASGRGGCCVPRRPATDETRLVGSRSEECPVCQFLAQKPVPVRSIAGFACGDLVHDWVPVHRVPRADPIASTHPIRGPPAVA